jgi:hypothetical protein
VAFLACYDQEDRTPRIAVAVKVGGGVSFGGYVERRPTKTWAGEVAIAWSPE